MPEKKSSKQPKKNKPGSRVGKPAVNLQLRDVSNITGSLNIAGRDVVNHITNIQGALTPGQVLEKDLQIEIDKLTQGVRSYLENLKGQALHDDVTIPYRGLEAYTLSDAEAFFGRDQAIREIREALKRSPLTILQAESGAGKTSLLQAGLIPRLMAEEHLAVWLRSQFDNPTVTIKNKFIGNLELTPKLANSSLMDFLRRITAMIGVQTTLYVILDQFEEFFSKHTPEEDRQAFIRDLAGCLNDSTLNVRWVISITTDAFGQLGKFEPHVQNPFLNVQSLYLLNRQEAAEVIAKPAQLHALTFQDGLLEQLLDDLGQQQNALIAPTQIQLVCLALYDDLRDKDATFTLVQYDQKGGAAGILHGYVANVLQHDLPLDERAPAYKIFEELVTSEKKRIIRGKADLETALENKGISHDLAESTLNHLVNRRLLRQLGDNPEQVQFEIVHDYLLREIEINDDVRNAKEAEELLDQGLKSWERHKLLLAPDVLKIIEARAVDHLISSAAAKLLFLSAIEYNRPAERWGELISAEDRKDLIASLASSKSNRKNREALWSLRRHLSKSQRASITFARSALAVLAFIQKGILLALIGVALFVVGVIGVDSSTHIERWRKVTRLNSQCLEGNGSANLLVAIDAKSKSHVVVYDSRSHILCETKNTGAKWTRHAAELPADLIINSIAVNSGIYLATDQGLYYQAQDSSWQNAKPTVEGNSAFEKIAIAAEAGQVYVSNEQDLLFRYDLTNGSWHEMPTEGITGKTTDITVNYGYFAVSTVDGIWYRTIASNGKWLPYDLKENVVITTLEMILPVRCWEHYFIDPIDDDWFLAVADQGGIYHGALTEGGLEKMPELPAGATPVASLAVNEYSKFVTGPGGLYCEQSWNILDSEWWLIRFGKESRCQ